MTTQTKDSKVILLGKRAWKNYSIVAVFVLIFVICSIAAPKFSSVNNVMTILRNCSMVGIIGLGMTFVIIAGGIDLSSGSVLAGCGTVLIFLQQQQILPLWLCMLITCIVGIILGLLNGIIITKAKLPPFIVTLALGIIVRSVTMFICRGATITGARVDEFTNIGNGSLKIGDVPVPIPFIVFLSIAVILTIVLKRTKFGTFVYAVGGNENSARFSGINVDLIKIATFVLIGLCVGISACIEMSRMAAVSSTASGSQYEFEAITAVIVGGTSLSGGKGGLVGSVLGVIILYIVTNMMIQMDISPYLSGAVKGLVILFAVLLQRRDK